MVRTLLEFLAHDIEIHKGEVVCNIAHQIDIDERLLLLKKYNKLQRLKRLYDQGIQEGWENWDWDKAEDKGWLCDNDYKVFDELKSL